VKKHIKALEARRTYLTQKLSGELPVQSSVFLSVFREEKDALDWALGKLEADPETCPWTGEILDEAVKAEETEKPGTTGHYGPVHEGDTVEAKIDVRTGGLNPIAKGETGKVIKFDRWIGEEYPYIVAFEGGRTSAYARNEIRKVD
jgi:hypothetical protein